MAGDAVTTKVVSRIVGEAHHIDAVEAVEGDPWGLGVRAQRQIEHGRRGIEWDVERRGGHAREPDIRRPCAGREWPPEVELGGDRDAIQAVVRQGILRVRTAGSG